MITNKLEPRIEELILNLQKLKTGTVPNFELKIGFLTIFSKNDADYELLKIQLRNLGEEKDANNGNKYLLKSPMIILGEKISALRIRIPDIHRQELGCCDLIYKESDYAIIKKMALDSGWDIVLRKGYEMIELSTFDLPVYAYLVKDN